MTRIRPLEGVNNFRDFGDYSAAGRHIRPGHLFRSAHHARATDDDLAHMQGLGIAAIVDLRRPIEREKNPSRRWENFAAQLVENDDPHEGDEQWPIFIQTHELTADSIHGHQLRFYAAAPFAQRHIDLFTRFFDLLAASEEPVLIHCAGGKDRTGMLAAFTHHIAGVHKDDILADYLLTNDRARFERELPLFREHLREVTGKSPDDAAMYVAMGVSADLLETTYRVLEDRAGGLDAYIANVLGVDAKKRDAIARNIFI